MTTSDERRSEPRMVAATNAEQAAAWDGEEGERWAEHAARYDASVRRHNQRLLEAAQISPNDHVLDIGCGCGESTFGAARLATSGQALGVDLSAAMIARARERCRAEGLANARFEQADAQVYPFEGAAFDLAISRFGAMFFGEPITAFRNIHRALRPGGRLALLAWQELGKNEWLLVLRDALAMGRALPEPPMGTPGPFGLARADAVRRLLAEAGCEAIDLEEVREPVQLGISADDAFDYVRTLGITKGLTEQLDETARARALEQVRTTLAAYETDAGVLLGSSAWLITARRR